MPSNKPYHAHINVYSLLLFINFIADAFELCLAEKVCSEHFGIGRRVMVNYISAWHPPHTMSPRHNRINNIYYQRWICHTLVVTPDHTWSWWHISSVLSADITFMYKAILRDLSTLLTTNDHHFEAIKMFLRNLRLWIFDLHSVFY